MKKKYAAIDEPKNGCGDIFDYYFDTAEEATDYAETMWNQLTFREKKKRHIYSVVISEEDLTEEAFTYNDDGSIEWCFYESCDYYDGYFDSDKLTEDDNDEDEE